MKRLTALSVLMFLPILHAYADNESPAKPEKAKSAKQQARDAVERLIKANDWRSAKPIQMELAAIGEAAVHPIIGHLPKCRRCNKCINLAQNDSSRKCVEITFESCMYEVYAFNQMKPLHPRCLGRVGVIPNLRKVCQTDVA